MKRHIKLFEEFDGSTGQEEAGAMEGMGSPDADEFIQAMMNEPTASTVRKYVSMGMDPNSVGREYHTGLTPLIVAIDMESPGAVKALLDQGASPSMVAQTPRGEMTAYDYASELAYSGRLSDSSMMKMHTIIGMMDDMA